MVVRRQSCRRRGIIVAAAPELRAVHRRFQFRMECHSGDRPLVRLLDSGSLDIFHQPSRTPGHSVCGPQFPSSSPQPVGVSLHGQHLGSGLPPQARGYQVDDTQYRGSVHRVPLRVQQGSSAPPVCAWKAQCPGGLPQPRFPGVGLRMKNGLCAGLPPA